MMGLLSKARDLRSALGLGNDGRDEFAFDPSSGISREDQKEILSEIEKVATQSRITVTPEVFAVKAVKRGILFPIIVNAGAIVALAVGLGVFYFFFQRGQTQISQEDSVSITAEGKLIAAVQKESEAKLQAKNQQIDQIQNQLAQIDKQRQDLQANMDTKIRDREAELRAAMAADLDAEKARLQKQGLSDQDIQKKLADLSAQQDASFTKQLDAFRAQAEADRQKSEATLKDLQAQFNANLAQANAERQQVLTESRQREADLQTQLAQKTTELASAQAQTQAQLTELASQKQQEDLVTQQLVGLYSVAQADIADKSYAKALTDLQAIGSYVNSADVMSLPGLAKRRTVDLFIVDSLSTLVQEELAKAKVDTTSLVNAANQIADVRANVAQADGFLADGKIADAERLYNQALAAIPEIAKSYTYFTAKAREAEAARQDALHAALTRAEGAFDGGRYGEMLSAYRDALGYLPEPSARLDRTISNLEATGAFQAGLKSQSDQTRAASDQSKAAAPILVQGNALLKDGKYADSLAQFLSVLSSYPLSSQAPQALKGISEVVSGMDSEASSSLNAKVGQVNSLSAQLATVQKQLDASVAELSGVKKSIISLLGLKQDPASADSAALMTALNQRYGSLSNASSASSGLQAQLDAANQRNTQLAASISRLNAENAALTSDLNAAREEAARQAALATQARQQAVGAGQGAASQNGTGQTGVQAAGQAGAADVSGLSAADQKRLDDLNALLLAYTRDYTAKEDANLAKYSQDQQKALMLSVGSRDSFLASLSKVFDGLLGRVKRYETQAASDGITTGRRSAMDDVLAVMTGLANQKTPDGRKSYLDARVSAEKDPKMKSVLGYLQQIVAGK